MQATQGNTGNALPSIIGLAGFKRTGKDTLADLLVTLHGYTKLAFAGNIRKEVSLDTGISSVADVLKAELAAAAVRVAAVVRDVDRRDPHGDVLADRERVVLGRVGGEGADLVEQLAEAVTVGGQFGVVAFGPEPPNLG